MQPAEARRSERIHYRGAVELLALGDAIEPRCVRGEAVDLGEGGMRVVASAQMAVGAPVTCRLELDGRPAALSGRVAWARRGDDAHGIGICFEALSGYDSALLQHMIERSRTGYRAVELRFAGLQQPILARARRRTNGLRLSAPLPIFARGNELSFRLDEEGPLLSGRIADASLCEDERARRIEVDVDVAPPEGGRFRRNARYGFPSEIERTEHGSIADAPQPQRAEATPEPRTQRTTKRTTPTQTIAMVPLAMSIAFGATVGYAAAAVEARPAAEPRGQPQERALSSEPAVATASLVRAATPVEVAMPTSAQPLAQSPNGSSAVSSPGPAPPIAPPALPERPFLFAPEVRSTGQRTIVRFPLDGSLDQLRMLRWAAPLALNLYIPNGRVPLSAGLYRARRGSVRSIAIKTVDGEQLVRVMLTAAPMRYAVHLDGGMLELNLEHE